MQGPHPAHMHGRMPDIGRSGRGSIAPQGQAWTISQTAYEIE